MTGHDFLVGDVADLHIIVRRQGYCHNVLAVQRFVNHAAANGVAVQPDEQIEQRCAVTDMDVFGALERALNFLGKIKRIVVALLIGKARVRR